MRSLYQLIENGVFVRQTIYLDHDKKQRLFEPHQSMADAVIDGTIEAAGMAAGQHIRFVTKEIKDARLLKRRSVLAKLRGHFHSVPGPKQDYVNHGPFRLEF